MDISDSFIDTYLSRGFGSMNKNDFEVWILSQLLSGRLKDKSNYEISIALKIPESKVKRLRYEADLKYSACSIAEYFEKLNEQLKKATIKENGESIKFSIEDISLRHFLDSCLKRVGRFSDTSFNSEIVVINIDDLEYLLCEENPDKELNKKIENLRNNNPEEHISLKSLIKKGIESSVEEGSKIITGKAIDLSIKGIIKLLPTLIALIG